jgi:glycine cleavage system aminomethyltransferase T
VYETLRAAGAAFGITDAGYKAINSLRMEKRYLYWSADISPDDTPFEAGLGFAVSLKKGDFLGRDALLAQKQAGLKRRLECFALETPLPVYGGEAMIANGRVIGMTTSGDFGHSVGRSLVLGYVPSEYFGQNSMEIEAFGRRSLVTRIDGCIYDPKNERIRL